MQHAKGCSSYYKFPKLQQISATTQNYYFYLKKKQSFLQISYAHLSTELPFFDQSKQFYVYLLFYTTCFFVYMWWSLIIDDAYFS